MTRDAQKRDGVSFSRVELTWDIDKMVENAGNGGVALNDDAKKQLAAGFKKLLGDKQVMWIGVDGKAVLQVSAPDWAAAEKMLDDYAKGTDGAGKLAAFRDVRKELPAETTFLAVVDFVRYFGVMLDATKPIFENAMPLPFKLPSAPKNVPATYVGASATLKPDRAGLDHGDPVERAGVGHHELRGEVVAPLDHQVDAVQERCRGLREEARAPRFCLRRAERDEPLRRDVGLRRTEVRLGEEDLSMQIGSLDRVVVGDDQSAHAGLGEGAPGRAAESAGAHEQHRAVREGHSKYSSKLK